MSTEADVFNVLLLGNAGVGKTALLHRLVEDVFFSVSSSTVGVGFLTKMINIHGQSFRMQVWDTAGQVREKEGV